MNDFFYCYSSRLQKFLALFGVEYVDKKTNNKTGKYYYIYKSSEQLTSLLQDWNTIKVKYDLKGVINKETGKN